MGGGGLTDDLSTLCRVQKSVLYIRLAALERRIEQEVALRRRRRRELVETRYRLRMARAGLLIALPHVAHPAARALVGCALEACGPDSITW